MNVCDEVADEVGIALYVDVIEVDDEYVIEHEAHEHVIDEHEVDDENEVIDAHDEHDTNELLLFHILKLVIII